MLKPQLLIVEDNEITRSLLFTVFDSLAFSVAELSNGNDVLPFLEEHPVDIVILDLELPGMSSDVIYDLIRKHPKYSKLPIIPFTARTDTQTPSSFTSRVTWSEYQKTGRILKVINKHTESGHARAITDEVIDEVTRKLAELQIPFPEALTVYYKENRHMDLSSVLDL